jgi:hypothetical protein
MVWFLGMIKMVSFGKKFYLLNNDAEVKSLLFILKSQENSFSTAQI